jgi:putative transposase
MDHPYPARPKRLKDFVYVGQIAYFLTICVDWRQRAFDDHEFARYSIQKLLCTAARFRCALYAYCLMPDHGHIVALGEHDDSDLDKFMRSWTTQTGFAWRRAHRGRLWQGGYYDHVLRSDISIYFAAQYVVMNPVHAGIVEDPKKYEFSGSTVCSIAELMMR